jgi:hypothetical protein
MQSYKAYVVNGRGELWQSKNTLNFDPSFPG